MSSRARGTSLWRRLYAPGKRPGPETGQCRNDRIVMVGKPDKMAARSAAQLRSRVIVSLRGRSELGLQNSRARLRALATGLVSRCKSCFVVGQVPSLCGDTDNVRLSHWPRHGSAGRTTGFLATPLLLCTATSRGKDDHYRGLFPHAGGEICFWWSEFWTKRNKTQTGLRSNVNNGEILFQNLRHLMPSTVTAREASRAFKYVIALSGLNRCQSSKLRVPPFRRFLTTCVQTNLITRASS